MIYWVYQETIKQHASGGAARTDSYVIEQAPTRVKLVTPKNFDGIEFKKKDLLILSNNAAYFNDRQRKEVFKHRYVIYNHDTGDDVRGWYGLFRRFPEMFSDSLLNIFLSPLHMYHFGSPKKSICNAPYFSEEFFDVARNREDNSVCCYGNLHYDYKGAENVARFAKRNPQMSIDIYSPIWEDRHIQLFNNLDNVNYCGSLNYAAVPAILGTYKYILHLPNWVEAFGRSVGEGYLCGCIPIVNDKVGAFSFDWSSNRETFRQETNEAPKKFWEEVMRLV